MTPHSHPRPVRRHLPRHSLAFASNVGRPTDDGEGIAITMVFNSQGRSRHKKSKTEIKNEQHQNDQAEPHLEGKRSAGYSGGFPRRNYAVRKTSKPLFGAPSGLTHVGDHEAAPGGLVLGLPCHDGAVDVVSVGSGREDEEERSQTEKDVEQGRNRTL